MFSLEKLFGNRYQRALQPLYKSIQKINELEVEFSSLSPEALQAKTLEFKERLSKDESLDKLLPEAYAAVREGAKRTLKERHFDVQLIGGLILHQRGIAEMKTV